MYVSIMKAKKVYDDMVFVGHNKTEILKQEMLEAIRACGAFTLWDKRTIMFESSLDRKYFIFELEYEKVWTKSDILERHAKENGLEIKRISTVYVNPEDFKGIPTWKLKD